MRGYTALTVLTFILAGPLCAETEGYPKALPTRGGLFAFFADGGAWTTTFNFLCLTNAGCTAEVSFIGSDGRPLAVPFRVTGKSGDVEFQETRTSSRFNITLAAGGSLIMESLGTSSAVATGGVDIISSSTMAGYAVLRQRVPGRTDYEATVPMEPRTAYTNGAVTFDNRNSFATGLAITNFMNDARIEVQVTGYDLAGNQLFSTSMFLDALSGTALDVGARFPQTQGRAGVLRLSTATGGFGGVAFRFNPTGPFATIPYTSF